MPASTDGRAASRSASAELPPARGHAARRTRPPIPSPLLAPCGGATSRGGVRGTGADVDRHRACHPSGPLPSGTSCSAPVAVRRSRAESKRRPARARQW